MKVRVEESDFVPCDILDIVRYLRRRNPAVSIRFVKAFKSTIALLSTTPELGRTRSDLGAPEVRSWRITGFRNYLVFYETLPDRIRILRVLHGYRDLHSEISK